MIEIQETKITATMSLREARALHKLLLLLPSKRDDITLSAAEFTPGEWDCLTNMYAAFDAEVGETAKAL